jgi:hypothetical protein
MRLTAANLRHYLRTWLRAPLAVRSLEAQMEKLTFDIGCLRAQLNPSASFPEGCEYRVFSQGGDDGIIQRLVRDVPVKQKFFVEFGVENYRESNTRFLLLKDNWSGLVMDGSPKHIQFIQQDPIYLRNDLTAVCAFIKTANINELLATHLPDKEIGLLSIDIDGNDYWIWKAIENVNPPIVITEYNYRFGPSRAVTVPLDDNFQRSQAHYSHIYYGCSLKALWLLARKKGYDLVCCNTFGNNAYWVRQDVRPASLPALTCEQAFRAAKFRETRDVEGRVVPCALEEQVRILESLPLVEITDP